MANMIQPITSAIISANSKFRLYCIMDCRYSITIPNVLEKIRIVSIWKRLSEMKCFLLYMSIHIVIVCPPNIMPCTILSAPGNKGIGIFPIGSGDSVR